MKLTENLIKSIEKSVMSRYTYGKGLFENRIFLNYIDFELPSETKIALKDLQRVADDFYFKRPESRYITVTKNFQDKFGNDYSKEVKVKIYSNMTFDSAIVKRKSKNFDRVEIEYSDIEKELTELKELFDKSMKNHRFFKEFARNFETAMKVRLYIYSICETAEEAERIIKDAEYVFDHNKEEVKKYLEKNGYTNIERLGAYEKTPDGYGHMNVKYACIDYFNKTIDFCYGNSGD